MDFIKELFTDLSSADSFWVLFWLTGAFLIGLLTAAIMYRRRLVTYRDTVSLLQTKNTNLTEKWEELNFAHEENLMEISRYKKKNRTLIVEKGQLHSELIMLRGVKSSSKSKIIAPKANLKKKSKKKKIKENVTDHKGGKDDLKKISGIGPMLEKKLNKLGVFSFKQISEFNHSFIEELTESLGAFPGRIERDQWVNQAKKLVDKKKK